ncbi:MAG: dephospho-CoA kinase [Rickettsiales bacterium]|nr:dephospho-CoA kinase [Rickettsiales bacterium]
MSGKNSSRTTIIGLTGGIASGKNFVAEIFAKNGAAVFDADQEVHNLLANNSYVISQVRKNFPNCFVDQKINRQILAKIVFANQKKLRILEKILHPQVRKSYQEFLKKLAAKKVKIAILNIPLLLESKAYKCDKIVAIIAPKSVQKKRFLARAQKNKQRNKQKNKAKNSAIEKENLIKKFEQIHQKQISNIERKLHADFIINSAISKVDTIKQVQKILYQI